MNKPVIPVILLQEPRRSSIFLKVPLPWAEAEHLLKEHGHASESGTTLCLREARRLVQFTQLSTQSIHPLVQALEVHPEDVPLAPRVPRYRDLKRVYQGHKSMLHWEAQSADGGRLMSEPLPLRTIMRSTLFSAPEDRIPALFERLAREYPEDALYVLERGLRFIGLPRRLKEARVILPLLDKEHLLPLFSAPEADIRLRAMRLLHNAPSLLEEASTTRERKIR